MTELAWPVQWSADFEVGIAEIDAQHRRLVAIANGIAALGGSRHAFEQELEAMMAYTQYHFALEERLMREADYPGLEAHRHAHEHLAEQVMALWRRRAELDHGELLGLLTAWLLNHILSADQDLRRIAARLAG